MRVLGLDIGEKRIGVAVSDPSGSVATPLAVLDARRVLGDGTDLRMIVDDFEVALVVVGLPLSMSGDEGPQAARVRSAGERVAALVGMPVTYWDERLSSAEARRSMTEAGSRSRQQRGSVDKVAASLILQSYLDSTRSGTTAEPVE